MSGPADIESSKSTMDKLADVIDELGIMSSPEVFELLSSVSFDASGSVESISEDLPIMVLEVISAGSVDRGVSVKTRNVLLGASSPRSVARYVRRVPDAVIDPEALEFLSGVVSSVSPMLWLLSNMEDGEPVRRVDGALVCGSSSVTVSGLENMSKWMSSRLEELRQKG